MEIARQQVSSPCKRHIASTDTKLGENEHLDSSEFQGGVNSPGPTLPVPLPLTFPPPSIDPEEEGPGSAPRRQDDIVDAREQTPLPDPKEIELPSGEVWNIDGACGERFCYEHGEAEYLLMTPNRWMSADSVGVPEAELDARLLQKDKVRPVKSKPAQCGGTLYSHVQRVIRKASHDGGNIYEIEWRNCWTRASHIGENDWLSNSLELNLDKSLRRSTRLSNTVDERKIRNERISWIMQLDL